MKILKTVQKVPGGMMVIPLLLGVILNTVCPSLLQAGGYVTALWSSGGANTAIAIFLFCVGAQIQLRQGGQILKRGFVLLFAKFLAGAVLGWVIGAIFGTAGVLGLSTLAIISAVTNSNGGLFMSLAGTFGDDTDIAAQAILNINDGPFLTLVAVGASGMADIPLQSILCAVAPILVPDPGQSGQGYRRLPEAWFECSDSVLCLLLGRRHQPWQPGDGRPVRNPAGRHLRGLVRSVLHPGG